MLRLTKKNLFNVNHSYNLEKIVDPMTENTHNIHSQLHDGISVFGRKARINTVYGSGEGKISPILPIELSLTVYF